MGSLSEGSLSGGVSVQGGLCVRGLCLGVSLQGGLCLGGLHPGESLSRQGSLSEGSLSEESLSGGLCPGWNGSLSRMGWSLSGWESLSSVGWSLSRVGRVSV